jgi:hypothetical protein
MSLSANRIPLRRDTRMVLCEPSFFASLVHFCTIERGSDPARAPSRIGDHDLVDRTSRRQTVGAAVEIK